MHIDSFLSVQCPFFCLLKMTTWFSLGKNPSWTFCSCDLGGINQLTSYLRSFSRVVRGSTPGEGAYSICLTTVIGSETGDATYVSPIRVNPGAQKDYSCHIIGVRMCKPEPPVVTTCPVVKAKETKKKWSYGGEGQRTDYVIWTSGSSHTWWNFQPLNFPINESFGLGHVSWLAITFSQQISDPHNIAGSFLKGFCIL